jgi:hypothetical protein
MDSQEESSVESGKTEPPLGPELQEAEETLEAALTEACATEPAGQAETGELIRLDEMLEVASEAAKRAISLRRRRRADRDTKTTPTGRADMADAEAAASPGGTHRAFTDTQGVQWDVFPVYPEARLSPHSQLKGTFPDGWLCYDSASEKRRLSPIPENWQTLSDGELERLAARAEVAGRRPGRSGNEPGSPESRQPGE